LVHAEVAELADAQDLKADKPENAKPEKRE
jgi:hypothetical protein